MQKTANSLTASFVYNAIAAIIITGVLVALSIIYLELHQFSVSSEKIERDYITTQKNTIRHEVNRIADYIENRRSQIKSILKQRIKQRVYDAHTIALNIYNQHKGNWPDSKIQQSIKAALRGLRFFDGDGYYFAHSLTGVLQIHGLKPEDEGHDRLQFRDSKGDYVVKNLIELVKKHDEGFLSYYYYSPSQPDTERQKLVFAKRFEPYNWLIGTGDYEENIEKIIQNQIADYINQVRFGKNSYIFVVSYDGVVIVNPTQQHLVGTNIWNLQDPNGIKVIQQERHAVDNPEGDFIYYLWNKPSSGKPSPKVTYMKGIADWQWMIGSGLYLDDVQATINLLNKDLKNSLLIKLLTLITVIFLAVIAIIYRTRRTSNKIDNDSKQFISSFENASVNSEKINIDNLKHTEFIALALSFNQILDKKMAIEKEKIIIELQLRQSQKMEALGTIVGGIAHDFNNLLGIVMGYSELLADQLKSDSDLKAYATQIYDASKRGSKLTNKLLGLSRFKEQMTSCIDLNQALNNSKDIIEKALTSQIEVELKLTEEPLFILVDESDFSDALFNLCINAMHAMADCAQPRLILKSNIALLSEQQLTLLQLPLANYIELTIIDNGSGIDSQVKEHIFEPFFTTKGEKGSGLGLSQVYAFMKRSNGSISVNSEPEKGTEISLFFPQHDPAANHIETD
ncbi:MAG: cache domain-containing protein [Gammaproteobacteria bacterium]|nr:cache domain-containing protein [Gammaproteobacteria bacterium]